MSPTLSENQSLFLEKVRYGQNVYLSGKAGTGKTFIVKKAIAELQAAGQNVVAIAPTGVAANNLGGQTIHSFFKLSIYGVLTPDACSFVDNERRGLFNRIDVIVIDEISMLRPDILDAIHWTLEKNKCRGLNDIQIIFVGDLKQLPSPVTGLTLEILLKNYKGIEFYHSHIYQALNVQQIVLDQMQRQSNEDFIFALNQVRDGEMPEYFNQFIGRPIRGVILAAHNVTVDRYNAKGLRAVNSPEIILQSVTEGNLKPDDYNLEKTIRVKNGCKIMYLANCRETGMVNGTLGTFVIAGDYYFIKTPEGLNRLSPVEFTKKEYVLDQTNGKMGLKVAGKITQYPIRLAYALTIHKSQGLTFEEMTLDLTGECFVDGQLYTALSRVKGPEGLAIII